MNVRICSRVQGGPWIWLVEAGATVSTWLDAACELWVWIVPGKGSAGAGNWQLRQEWTSAGYKRTWSDFIRPPTPLILLSVSATAIHHSTRSSALPCVHLDCSSTRLSPVTNSTSRRVQGTRHICWSLANCWPRLSIGISSFTTKPGSAGARLPWWRASPSTKGLSSN